MSSLEFDLHYTDVWVSHSNKADIELPKLIQQIYDDGPICTAWASIFRVLWLSKHLFSASNLLCEEECNLEDVHRCDGNKAVSNKWIEHKEIIIPRINANSHWSENLTTRKDENKFCKLYLDYWNWISWELGLSLNETEKFISWLSSLMTRFRNWWESRAISGNS